MHCRLINSFSRFSTNVINPVRCATTVTKSPAKRTPLYALHLKYGGQMAEFAGFQMPIRYKGYGDAGSIVNSHCHTRAAAGLFDVSHMLQSRVTGTRRHAFMESLTVADVSGLAPNHSQLTLFTTVHGGIVDDLIVTNTSDEHLYVVSNAGCAVKDWSHMKLRLDEFHDRGEDVQLERIENALLALQGPLAAPILARVIETLRTPLEKLEFMSSTRGTVQVGADAASKVECRVSRCGYTGEDGFEISVQPDAAQALAERLLAVSVNVPGAKQEKQQAMLIGLGARDTLRLEAGLCLYGHELDEATSPVEAGLAWLVSKRRRAQADFPGASYILGQLAGKVPLSKKRVGLLFYEASASDPRPPPVREKSPVFTRVGAEGAAPVGAVTSGTPSPSLGLRNIAMAYVKPELTALGTSLAVEIRGSRYSANVVKLPFVPSHYYYIKKNK